MSLKRKTCPACSKTKTIKHGFYNKDRSYCILCDRRKTRLRMQSLENKARQAWRHACEKAEKLGVENTLTEDDVIYLFKLANGQCAYTGKHSSILSLEHVIPMNKGGANSIGNVIVVDLYVNRQKRDNCVLEIDSFRHAPGEAHEVIKLLAARGNRDIDDLYWELREFQQEQNTAEFRKFWEKYTALKAVNA